MHWSKVLGGPPHCLEIYLDYFFWTAITDLHVVQHELWCSLLRAGMQLNITLIR